ncbi:hypothetical protein GQL56_30410, partial [Pseudomonas putida]|nr:hypothetical protein [Pseudomonas putida]
SRDVLQRFQHWKEQGCSVRQLYHLQLQDLPRVPWKNLIIQNYARPKATFNLWLFLQDRLPTKDRLHSWGMTVDQQG